MHCMHHSVRAQYTREYNCSHTLPVRAYPEPHIVKTESETVCITLSSFCVHVCCEGEVQ